LRVAVILDLALVAWFMLLAGGELFAARRRGATDAANDGRLVTNFGLGALVLLANALLPLIKVGSAVAGQSIGSGLAMRFAWPWALTFAVLLFADSFVSYWTHRMMHTVRALWRIHRVHHADSAVDVSTSLRHHPLELLVSIPMLVLIYILGAPPSVVVATQTIMLAAGIWQHADIEALRLERILAPWLITPALHRLHHSPERILHDGNYGDLITLWDRLFGTLRTRKGRERVGLDGQVARADRLLEQIWSPVYAP
jgi:sterol desaturase/sphingolipid hydroxylase (fatty acid hydroxylase superfamily)